MSDDPIITLVQGLTYSAEFVPQSKSRNAGGAPCLNWRVKLEKNGRVLLTDYMQGCAHLPHYEHRFARIAVYDDAVKLACEAGTSLLVGGKRNAYDACQEDKLMVRAKPIPPPALADVLYSLVSDSDVLDYATFEDWAVAFGYETDSRAAEKTYRACLEIALTLRQLIDIDAARRVFQGY